MTRQERLLKYVGGVLLLSALAMFFIAWSGGFISWVDVEKIAVSESSTSVKGGIKEVYRLGLGPGDLLLESIRAFIKEHDIRDGAVLTGIGSLSECQLHWPTKVEYPSTSKYETFKGPLEITGIQGIIADYEPHLHMMIAEKGDTRTAGGHMEDGCKVLYLVELTIAKFDGPRMTRRPNKYNVKMLPRK